MNENSRENCFRFPDEHTWNALSVHWAHTLFGLTAELTKAFWLNHREVIPKMRTEPTCGKVFAGAGSVIQVIGVLMSTLLLASCGVGWEDTPTPNITTASTTTPKYSTEMRITLGGSNLDQGIVVSSPGCTGMRRSTTPPFESSATLAYYLCTVSAVGNNELSFSTSTGSSLGKLPYDVLLPQVTMTISNGLGIAGNVVYTLRPDIVATTVVNFLAYVNSGYYSGTVFHRIGHTTAPSSTNVLRMIQGGGFISSGTSLVQKSPLYAPIPLEVGKGLSNVQWSIAMARTTTPNSATSQFFINYLANTLLDTSGGGYAVFGTVTAGFSVVDAISAVTPCTARTGITDPPYCTPDVNILVNSAAQTR